jgi:DNA-binding transcriptional ArsR family regulator
VPLTFLGARPAGDRTGLDLRAENAEIRLGLSEEHATGGLAGVGAVQAETDAADHLLHIRLGEVGIGVTRARRRALDAVLDTAQKQLSIERVWPWVCGENLSNCHVLSLPSSGCAGSSGAAWRDDSPSWCCARPQSPHQRARTRPGALSTTTANGGVSIAHVPIDQSRLNTVGDFVLTEVDELRALADPVRLDLFDLVRRDGPLTVESACARLGIPTGEVSSHLQQLADAGLIDRDDSGSWSTEARGIYFEIPDEPTAQQAARELSNTMLVRYGSLPSEWVRRVEPLLDVSWARAAGLFNARIELTPDELRRLQEDLEQLLEPYTNRSAEHRPAGAAPVRITAYFLPEPD